MRKNVCILPTFLLKKFNDLKYGLFWQRNGFIRVCWTFCQLWPIILVKYQILKEKENVTDRFLVSDRRITHHSIIKVGKSQINPTDFSLTFSRNRSIFDIIYWFFSRLFLFFSHEKILWDVVGSLDLFIYFLTGSSQFSISLEAFIHFGQHSFQSFFVECEKMRKFVDGNMQKENWSSFYQCDYSWLYHHRNYFLRYLNRVIGRIGRNSRECEETAYEVYKWVLFLEFLCTCKLTSITRVTRQHL